MKHTYKKADKGKGLAWEYTQRTVSWALENSIRK